LADQLIGQYLVEVGGMGPLVSPENIRETLRSIYKYNYKPTLQDHDNVERTYALNEEAAVLVCDYGKVERPHIPFPYYAEAWTGRSTGRGPDDELGHGEGRRGVRGEHSRAL